MYGLTLPLSSRKPSDRIAQAVTPSTSNNPPRCLDSAPWAADVRGVNGSGLWLTGLDWPITYPHPLILAAPAPAAGPTGSARSARRAAARRLRPAAGRSHGGALAAG